MRWLDHVVKHHARITPAGLAVIDADDTRYDWAQFDALVDSVASGLRANSVTIGDRVVVVARSSAFTLAAYCAVNRIGAIICPVNPASGPDETQRARVNLAPAAVVMDGQSRESGPWSGIPTITDVSNDVRGPAVNPTAPADALDDLAIVFATAGSTGTPKQIGVTNMSLYAEYSRMRELVDVSARERSEVFGSVCPVFHGSFVIALSYWAAGHPIAFVSRFDPDLFTRIVLSRTITHTFLVPTMMSLLHSSAFVDSPLRHVVYGGAPLAPALELQWLRDVDVTSVYGITEGGGPVAYRFESTGTTEPGTGSGVPFLGTVFRVVDREGTTLPDGETGELVVSGTADAAGYVDWSTGTRRLVPFASEGIPTGDRGYVSESGSVHITGRLKNIIIRAGQNISAEEIEAVLDEMPGVTGSVCLPVEDAVYGEVPVAIVSVAGSLADIDVGAVETEARRHCAGRLTRYKVPDRVVVIEGTLPKNAVGKLDRQASKALLMPADSVVQ